MSQEEKINWYRSPIPREKLLELNRRGNVKGLVHIIAFLVMAAGTAALAYSLFYRGLTGLFLAALFVHCSLFQFYGRVAASHELCHHTVFKSKWLNELFIALFTFLAWENSVYYRARHTRHHQYTAHNEQDAELSLPILLTPWNWLLFFTFDVYKFWDAIQLNTLFSAGVVKGRMNNILFPESNPKSRADLYRRARILLFGHLFLMAVFLYFKLWPMVFLVSLAPFMCQWLNMLVALPQHAGMQGEVDDFRRCCRTMELGPVLSFLYFNMQYHTEHHLYASVPFYNLPELRKALEADLPKTSGGLLVTWNEIAAAMKRQKTDPTYYLPVDVPKN